MSGHNKWSKIKKGKEIKDKQKSNNFSKLSRVITLSVSESGGVTDPENNFKLRLAIDKAKSFNFPKENIERAIAKGIGPGSQQLKEIVYEAFGPGGISLIILASSDNINRTLSEVRNVLDLHNGKLGNQGSVAYLFKKCGLVIFRFSEAEEKSVIEFADKIKAFDIDEDEENFYVYLPYEFLGKVKENLGSLKVAGIDVDYKPNLEVGITEELKYKVAELIEALESLEDVHKVYTNGKI